MCDLMYACYGECNELENEAYTMSHTAAHDA